MIVDFQWLALQVLDRFDQLLSILRAERNQALVEGGGDDGVGREAEVDDLVRVGRVYHELAIQRRHRKLTHRGSMHQIQKLLVCLHLDQLALVLEWCQPHLHRLIVYLVRSDGRVFSIRCQYDYVELAEEHLNDVRVVNLGDRSKVIFVVEEVRSILGSHCYNAQISLNGQRTSRFISTFYHFLEIEDAGGHPLVDWALLESEVVEE